MEALAQRLAAHCPLRATVLDGTLRASVALVVRPEPGGLELLLIKRTVFPGDPWSGHMAFPGGRRDPRDPDDLATARREAHEEVGLDLGAYGSLLGALNQTQPASGAPPVVISPFVFAVPAGTSPTPNHEVELALWIPLRDLRQPGTATEYLHELADGSQRRFPAFGYRGQTIWGLTHRILSQFLNLSAPPHELFSGARAPAVPHEKGVA